MRVTRRELLAGTGVGLAASLAGCAGEVTAEGAAFGAVEASLSANVQSETGYTHHRTVEDTVSEQFERFGFTRTVDVTNVISEYDRAIDLGILGMRLQAAVFATLSTPQVRILTRTFNPVAEMSSLEIAEMIQQRYENIHNATEDGVFTTEVAGQSTTVTRFTADAQLIELGQRIEIYLYVSEAVEVGDDFVLTIAAHPRAFGRAEDTVSALLAGIEH